MLAMTVRMIAIAEVFQEIRETDNGVRRWRATEDWKDFVREALTFSNGGVTERKTGL
jgi:hypothetical protein